MTSGLIVLNAYEIDYWSDGESWWEVYGNDADAPDVFSDEEFGDWINDSYTRQNYDVRVFTLDSYYEGLAADVD